MFSAIVLLAMIVATACSPVPRPGAWHMIGTVPGMEAVSGAVPLPDGRVLILTGGSYGPGEAPPDQIFDPARGIFTPAAPSPTTLEGSTITRLRDGSVLVAGGGFGDVSSSAASVYSPATNRWIAVGHMHTPRSLHTATLLADGRVLVAGGQSGSDALASAEIFDPKTRTWSPTGSMRLPRTQATAVTLPDGRVLIAGGYSNVGEGFFQGPTSGFPVYYAEIWNPTTGQWSLARDLASNPTVVSLPDGRVLVAGGSYGFASTSETFLFDPRTGRWTAAGNMPSAFPRAQSVLLSDGRLLLLPSQPPGFEGRVVAAGGPLTYDPSNNYWAQATTYPAAFSPQDAVKLGTGKTLVVSNAFFAFPAPGQQPPKPSLAEFDPGGYPALPGSTGPLASTQLVRDLALAAIALLVLLLLRVALIRRRPEILS